MSKNNNFFTIEAAKLGVRTLDKMEDADERFMFLISDANLQRYYITPEEIGEILTSKKNVQAFIIFIASQNQAKR